MDELLIKAIKTKVRIAFSQNKLANIISKDNEEIVGMVWAISHNDAIIKPKKLILRYLKLKF